MISGLNLFKPNSTGTKMNKLSSTDENKIMTQPEKSLEELMRNLFNASAKSTETQVWKTNNS